MTDYRQQQGEAAAIRADMQKTHAIIHDAKNRYIKEKLKARSKKQAESTELLFADLASYDSRQSIQEAYGWDAISASEYERLLNLWDEREQLATDSQSYRDGVVEMLEKAISHIGDDYQEILFEADEAFRENERNQNAQLRF
jgi:hypothetical protein